MSALKSPNINATPADPVEMWGFEGILAAIDRGSLQHWHRIIVAVRRDPERPVARDPADVVEIAEDVGVVARVRRLLASVNAHQVSRDSRQ